MRKIYMVALLFCALAASGQNKKLVIIGSSTSACTGPTIWSNCYVPRFDAYQDGTSNPVDITQLAVGGHNVYHGMPTGYLPPSPYWVDPNNNITRALSLNPDAIIVNYPSNAFDVMGIDSIMHCFRTIRNTATAAGKLCYITTTQPRTSFTAAGRAKLKEIRDSIMLQFGSFAINFYDDVTDFSDLTIAIPFRVTGDNIHLNDNGHLELFESVRDANIFQQALPVRLQSFSAAIHQGRVRISWVVADETSGTKYELQRSADGSSFETVQTIVAPGASARRNYEINDAGSTASTTYYRLRITEAGRSMLSRIEKVSLQTKKMTIRTFLIDAQRQQLMVRINSQENANLQFNFINSAGVFVRRQVQPVRNGDNTLYFNISDLPAGTYWTECIANNQNIFTKAFSRY